MGIDVEYLKIEKVRQAGGGELYLMPVKFVCGEAKTGDNLPPGNYATVINVISLFARPAWSLGIGLTFVSGPYSKTGAAVVIPPLGAVVLDCNFILGNLTSLGLDPNRFHEGFVVIEETTRSGAIRASAVYAVLHKQLHPLPDLEAVETAARFCRLDAEKRLIVTIRNGGERDAPESKTGVDIEGIGVVTLDTPPLAPGEQADLAPVEVWASGRGRVDFTIYADQPGAILESNELNNKKIGQCERVL